MEICVISHESCPGEGGVQCGIRVMAKGEVGEGPRPNRRVILFTAVCSLTLALRTQGGVGRTQARPCKEKHAQALTQRMGAK